MEAGIAIQVLPKVEGESEVVRVVDEVIAYIASTGLTYQVGAFETSIEGNYDELMEIVKNCQLIAIKAGSQGVSAYVKITYKPEGDVFGIEEKTKKHQH
ncbi:thiamine-binding protein [Enterococcus thailandicus]|nr:thiamine-binding protein [Enterococcus thailandicus]